MIQRSIAAILGVCAVIGFTGCSTYSQKGMKVTEAWQAGNGTVAATNITVRAEKAIGTKDELIWRLEQGKILSAVKDIEGSLTAFNEAEKIVDRYEEEAKFKTTKEAMALFSNQANLPYRGRSYDKIMLNTYKALNYLILAENDKARIELNRAMQRQKDAVSENKKNIEDALEVANQAKEGELKDTEGDTTPGYDVSRAEQDAGFAAAVNAEMEEIDARILPYADYVNPFSVFVDGLFFSHAAVDSADVERALKSFERVNSMSPGTYISADYAMVESMASGGTAETLTYVIFATGSAVSRKQIRIDLPLFLLTDQVTYIGAAFPRLDYHENYIPQMRAAAGEFSGASERLCSMDSVISRDFKNDWPVMMTKTLLTTATKAIAGRAAEEIARQNGNTLALYAVKAASAAYQAATNVADLRSWTTLPKEFAYIRMPTPADGQVSLQVGMISQAVSVTPGKTNIIMVRSINDTAHPIIEQFTLN
jgi:hypothetical protein